MQIMSVELCEGNQPGEERRLVRREWAAALRTSSWRGMPPSTTCCVMLKRLRADRERGSAEASQPSPADETTNQSYVRFVAVTRAPLAHQTRAEKSWLLRANIVPVRFQAQLNTLLAAWRRRKHTIQQPERLACH